MDDGIWEHSVCSKNRDRLLNSAVARRSFGEVNRRAKRFMSDEHFTVDGTLIQAWASQKSFRSKDGSEEGDGTNFHGQERSNQTHESTTDGDSRLYGKSYGKESKLSYLGHALVENRNGLIVATMVIVGREAENAATVELRGGDSLEDRFAILECEERIEALLQNLKQDLRRDLKQPKRRQRDPASTSLF